MRSSQLCQVLRCPTPSMDGLNPCPSLPLPPFPCCNGSSLSGPLHGIPT